MNKKLMPIVVSLTILSIIFALNISAKDSEMPSKPVSIDIMGYEDFSISEESWIEIVRKFEKKYPKINIIYDVSSDEAYHQKVRKRIAEGDIPDLAYMGLYYRWGEPWKKANLFVDHRQYIDKNFYDMSLIPSMGPNDEIYMIPKGTPNITSVLFMNKRLLKELGLKVPKTYEDIVKMVPVAEKAGIQLVTIDGADSWAWGACLLSCIIARMSGELDWAQKVHSGKRKFTDPEFVNSLKMIEQMVEDGVISQKSILVDYGTNITNYTDKKALFMIQGQWAFRIENKEVQNATELMAWPKFPGEKGAHGSVAAITDTGYGMTKQCIKNRDKIKAAMLFLKYFYSNKEMTQRIKAGAIVAPILKNYKAPEDLSPVLKSKIKLAYSAKTSYVIDAYITGKTNDLINSSIQKIVLGKLSPEQAAKEIQNMWERQIRN